MASPLGSVRMGSDCCLLTTVSSTGSGRRQVPSCSSAPESVVLFSQPSRIHHCSTKGPSTKSSWHLQGASLLTSILALIRSCSWRCQFLSFPSCLSALHCSPPLPSVDFSLWAKLGNELCGQSSSPPLLLPLSCRSPRWKLSCSPAVFCLHP